MGIFAKKDKTSHQAPVADKPKSETKPRAKKTATAKPKVAMDLPVTQRPYRILLKPVISEKATIANSLQQYVFEVDVRANKVEIKKAIQELYKVAPLSINIINQAGKKVRVGRTFGTRKRVKKAIVTLKKGETIKLYEGI
ncbi:MAG: 50S ribosomal protein L23 [Patescibacteria group bacterium]